METVLPPLSKAVFRLVIVLPSVPNVAFISCVEFDAAPSSSVVCVRVGAVVKFTSSPCELDVDSPVVLYPRVSVTEDVRISIVVECRPLGV